MPKPFDGDARLATAISLLRGMQPQQIAKLLEGKGIKGRPATVSCCPLAELFHQTCGGRYIVGQKYVMLRNQAGDHEPFKIPTPKPLATFQRMFDHAEFPQLVAPPPRVLGETPKRKARRGPRRKIKPFEDWAQPSVDAVRLGGRVSDYSAMKR